MEGGMENEDTGCMDFLPVRGGGDRVRRCRILEP